MKIITLYEAGSSDGYRSSGEGMFYLNEHEARIYSSNRHKGFGAVLTHDKVLDVEGKYFLLARVTPIAIVGTPDHEQLLKQNDLNKLTKSEQELLGLV